jgi:hypothetical protein
MLRLIKRKIGPVDLIQLTPLREPALYGYWLSKHLKTPWVTRIACSGTYGDLHYMSGNWLTKRLLPDLVKSCLDIFREQGEAAGLQGELQEVH